MSNKVIFILIDGLNFDTAVKELGYMESLVVNGLARRWKMQCELPSNSRPLYETVHTGLAPIEHGILSNDHVRLSTSKNIFSICREHQRSTAAAAYSWFSEMYNQERWDIVEHSEQADENQLIQYGRFYQYDDYPDQHLFADAERLVRQYQPDYLLVHPMGCDFFGHMFGGDSAQYARKASRMDQLLCDYIPAWRAQGYQVVVSADHGMDAFKGHGGTRSEVVDIPFYLVADGVEGGCPGELADQKSVAPTLLRLLELPVPEEMKVSGLII